MIQPNELRIGNWYKWSGLASMGRGYDYIKNGADIDRYTPLRDPIPLTPEILEKAGFEIHGDGGRGDGDSVHCKWGSLEVEYILGYSYFRIWGTAPWQIKTKYVHQLQNLYFALTGTELEIKL